MAKELAYTAENGAKIKVSPFGDPSDFKDNFMDAKRMADQLKHNVDIEAHLDGEIIKTHRNPEYRINGAIADRKAPEGLNYKNILRKAAKQKCEYVVINNEKNNDTIDNIKGKLKNLLKQKGIHPSIQKIILIIEGKASEFTRKDLIK